MNRRIFWVAGGMAAVAVLIAVAVPLVVPTGALRAEIERRVSAETGRPFRIAGPLSFTVFPDIGLEAGDVRLANVPGGHAADLLRVARMHIAVRVLPLLSGRVEAREIVLEKPVIALEVARDGDANWTLKAVASAAHTPRIGLPPQTRFAGVRIEDGTVRYANDRLGEQRVLTGVDAKVALTTVSAPASATGAFTYRGRTLGYSLSLTTVDNLLAGRTTRANLALTSDFLNAGFFGTVTRDGVVAGQASLRAPSLKDVAAWLGHPVTAGRGLGALDLKAHVTAKDRELALDHVAAKLDGMQAGGYLRADLTNSVPVVTGRLDVDRLDLNTYLAAPPAASSAPMPGPRPAGPEGWSAKPLKLDVLKLIDGQMALNVGALDVLHMKLGKTSIALGLAGGLMTAHLSPMALYGGTGAADLTVDARGAAPVIANKLAFRGIAMRPFLADTIGNDRIDGRGDILLDIGASGGSPDAVMRSLSGKGAVSIGNGQIEGVDMGRVARSIATLLSAGAVGDGAVTAFDRFTGSFVIAKGVLTNGDLKMTSAFINMTGRGNLDLGNRTIDFRIEPKASIGGRLHLLDVGVPFNISGSWSHVRYRPDLGAAIGGLVSGVLGAGAAPVEGLIGALGGDGGSKKPAPADPKKKHKGVGDRLKGIFGIH